jgi:glutaredoxin
MTNAIIWTQNRNLDCVKAIGLASRMGLTVEERNINSNRWTLSDLQAAVPGANTLPQIVVGDTVIGGFAQLVAKSKEQQAATPKVSVKTKEERVAAVNSKIRAEKTAKEAAKSDAKQAAIQAAMEGTNREQRHAAKNEAIANTKTYREAQRPAPRMTPQGYIIGAPVNAPAEHHQTRFDEVKAARPARIAANKAAGAEARATRIAAKTERVAASKAARLQRVGIA